MKKRALVLGTGALRGAYDAGVATTLCRELGHDFFDAIYGSSAGAYTATYFALNQPDDLENLWRNYLYGNRFINLLNPLYGYYIANLEYLAYLMQNGETTLHTENLSYITTRLRYVVTEQHTGRPIYIQPTQENVFDLNRASSAMPLVHPPVVLNGTSCIDGGLVDPLPFAKALEDGHDEVVVVYNKPKGFFVGNRYDTFSYLLAMGMPKQTAHLVRTLKFLLQEIERGLEQEPRLKIIRPKVQLPLKSILDTNKARLNACVDMGIADAKEFLKTYHG